MRVERAPKDTYILQTYRDRLAGPDKGPESVTSIPARIGILQEGTTLGDTGIHLGLRVAGTPRT